MIYDKKQILSAFIPNIKRARMYRLYDDKANRIIDLYQNNGHAILGHRAYRLTTILKNVISKGLIFDLPSQYSNRLKKSVKELIPGINTVFLTNSCEQGLKVISETLQVKISEDDIFDPLLHENKGTAAIWRPFTGDTFDSEKVIIPVLPFSLAGAPFIVCFKEKYTIQEGNNPPLSPLILAGTIRALYDLKKYQKPEWLKDDILKNAKNWEQKGIYIIPRMNEREYESEFKVFLKNGILLSPYFPGPSIFPAELSDGELRKILRLLNKE